MPAWPSFGSFATCRCRPSRRFYGELPAGLEFVHLLTVEPGGVRRFFVGDPDGTVLDVLGHN